MVILGCAYFLLMATTAAAPFSKTVFNGSMMPFCKLNAMNLHPPLPEQFREQRADAVQRGYDDDARDNRYVRNIIKEGIFVFPHDLLVIEEDDQKDQRRRKQGDCNDLDKERDEHEGCPGDQDDTACGDEAEEVKEVEPDGFLYLVIQGMCPPEHLAECPRARERYAERSQKPCVKEADGKQGPYPWVRGHHDPCRLCGTLHVHT